MFCFNVMNRFRRTSELLNFSVSQKKKVHLFIVFEGIPTTAHLENCLEPACVFSFQLPLEVIDKISRNHRLYNIIYDNYPKLLTGKTPSNELHYNTIQPDSKISSEVKQSLKKARQDEEERRNKRKRSDEDEDVTRVSEHLDKIEGLRKCLEYEIVPI